MNVISKLKEEKKYRLYFVINIIVILGLLVEFILLQYGYLKIARYLVLAEGLFIIAWKDGEEHIIPNKYLLIMLGIRALILVFELLTYSTYGISLLTSAMVGLVIGGSVFALCYFFSRGGMGAGDVKLMAVLGFYLGSSTIMPTMILIVFSSAIYGMVKLIKRKTGLKSEMPFGPFVLIGTVLSMILGV